MTEAICFLSWGLTMYVKSYMLDSLMYPRLYWSYMLHPIVKAIQVESYMLNAMGNMPKAFVARSGMHIMDHNRNELQAVFVEFDF